MIQSLRSAVKDLKAALLLLDATREKGFEGLFAVVLTEITGVSFRLAGSGSQQGIDAAPAFPGGAVMFECKLYKHRVPRKEVFSKLGELVNRDDDAIDLWVLGATCSTTEQLVRDIRKAGNKIGISTLILDWTLVGIPWLAVALAMASRVDAFLQAQLDGKDAAQALAALDAIRQSDEFAAQATRLRSELQEPTIGTDIARRVNTEWLTSIFSSEQKARQFLGQALAPFDPNSGARLARIDLTKQLGTSLSGAPAERVVAVIGDEGNGKSWLIAEGWASLEDKPLMLVLMPDDFTDVKPRDSERLVVAALTEQTGDRLSDACKQRWQRKLQRWRDLRADEIRLVVVVDGLNQRPQNDWGLLLAGLASFLAEIGGHLVITARRSYFDNWVERRLSHDLGKNRPEITLDKIEVPEWTKAERDEILQKSGIRAGEVPEAVAERLRNPRFLRIALDLLAESAIEDLGELTVNRLEFEYIRANELDGPAPLPGFEFARKLQKRAEDVLARIKTQQVDDLDVFEGGLEAVAHGHFFKLLPGDPTQYRVEKSGLALALGLAILHRARRALDNKRDVSESLNSILEPLNALPGAAEALFAALFLSCTDSRCPSQVGAAILVSFAEMQNPNAGELGAFCALARTRVEVFMQAANRLCLAGGSQPNMDWVEVALQQAKKTNQPWLSMSEDLREWLTIYSKSPDQGVSWHSIRDTSGLAEKERRRNQQELERKFSSLSVSEREFLAHLKRQDDGDLAALTQMAFLLMAGKPLVPFAEELVKWSFAYALSPDRRSGHYNAFLQLVRFNAVDWSDTREALLRACSPLQSADVSETGRWAYVNLLRATGDCEDAQRAETLVEELTAAWPKAPGWRLVETYCATDPFDPASSRPDNIASTSKDYGAIDVSVIRLSRGPTKEDHFFSAACPGVARFEADIAVRVHKAFIANVLERTGPTLRQGLFELVHDNSLLTREDALRLIRPLAAAPTEELPQTLDEDDKRIISGYRALLAFPQLSGREQVDTLLSQPPEDPILLGTVDVMKPLDEETFEALLKKACDTDDEYGQFRLLIFGAYTETTISEEARSYVAALVLSASGRVRTEALAAVARLDDEHLIDAVLQSGWSAAKLTEDERREAWHGSTVITQAAVRGLISTEEALDRMAPVFYGRAATLLPPEAVRGIAQRIDVSLRTAAGLTINHGMPDIELPVGGEDDRQPEYYSVQEKPSVSGDPVELFKRMQESDHEFSLRQKRAHEAFDVFRAELNAAKAEIILRSLSIREFDKIAASDPALSESWYQLFEDPKANLAAIRNLGHLLAPTLSLQKPEQAARLFTLLNGLRPLVRLTFGHARVPLDAVALWSTVDHPVLDELRWQGLDKAGNDHQLALEVVAALRKGRGDRLRAYVQNHLATGEPAKIARALTVVGFSAQNDFNDETLAQYKGAVGFIGGAYRAALYAYERNSWAEHWYECMQDAKNPEEFWRCSVLFSKIVDGRVDIWREDSPEQSEPFRMFWPSVESGLHNRLEKWRRNREKKLFGSDLPSPAFLE